MHRRFELHRDQDASGISGTGVVAEGVLWSNGWVNLLWKTERAPNGLGFYAGGMDDVEKVHGHGGRSRIVWVDCARCGGPVGDDEGAVCTPCSAGLTGGLTGRRPV
jgi:hypothetical protein